MQLKGADPAGLTRLVKTHAGPNPPVAPLPKEIEDLKNDGNVSAVFLPVDPTRRIQAISTDLYPSSRLQKLFQSGSYPESILKYTAAIELMPTSALLFTNRSLAHYKAKNATEAVADAREAVKLDEKAGKGWVRLGDGLVLQGGEKTEAEAACEYKSN